MAKLVALLVAAFAFQAVLAGPFDYEQQNSHARTIKKNFDEVSQDAVRSLDNISLGDHETIVALAAQANEYAHDVHTAVYHLYEIIQHTQRSHVQETLDKVAHVLNDYAHEIHQVITDEPRQLKNVLKQNIVRVTYQINALTHIVEQYQQQSEHGEEKVIRKVQKVAEELLDATHQFQFRGQVQHDTHYETRGNIQEYTQQITNVIQRINSYDDKTAHELAHQAYELSHLVGHIIHHLLRELHSQGDSDSGVYQQIINKLGEIRVNLDHIVKSNVTTAQTRVQELKTQLRTDVHDLTVQIGRLVQAGQHADQDINNLVKYVVSDVYTGYQHLYRNLEQLAGNQHHEQY